MLSKISQLVMTLAFLSLGACATTGGESSGSMTAGHATTKSERAARADDLFILFDADGDGFITRAELEKGLRSASNIEPNPNLMMALDKNQKTKKKAKVSRALTEAQVKRAVEQAFKTGSDKKLEERLSKEDFRKVVAERPPTESEDPWAPFM